MFTLNDITTQTAAAVRELFTVSKAKPGDILIIGCSTSEVMGGTIGKASSPDAAAALYDGIASVCAEFDVTPAFQCCEHLNRAVVTEREAAALQLKCGIYTEVNAVPQPKAGGSLPSHAYRNLKNPVVLSSIRANCGMDIGGTLIGMHLKPVAVPVRLKNRTIGDAFLICARTRVPFTGGSRAVYDEEKM
ncbi:MAG: TIGR01440 family protein [Clostridia bacterium]|nr:TIGR01440 family protein [Clostridia bacterium]